MATLTLTVPNGDVPRLVDSFIRRFGPKQVLDPGPPPVEETDAEYMGRIIPALMNQIIKSEEGNEARDVSLATHVDAAITLA